VGRRTDALTAEVHYCAMDRSRTPKPKKIMPGEPRGAPPPRGNLLLEALDEPERQQFIARCESVELTFSEVLCEKNEHMPYVYFPTTSFVSLISSLDGGHSLEVGLVGREGMLGASLLLGVNAAPLKAIVQGTGHALRMDSAQFARQIARSPALAEGFRRYVYVLVSQLAQMAACTRFHVVEERVARWLLMTRDRASSDVLYLTQDFVASMLGVRRAGITRAATMLKKRKLIRYSRGNVYILDRRGLEAASCECYSTATQTYARVMEPAGLALPARAQAPGAATPRHK